MYSQPKMAFSSVLSMAAALGLLAAVCLWGDVHAKEFEYPEKEGRYNITVGHKHYYDTLLFKDEPQVSSKLMRVQSYDLCYPKWNSHDRVNIAYYSVVSVDKVGLAHMNKKNHTDERRVCFHVKTKKGTGYHFQIEVWGKKF